MWQIADIVKYVNRKSRKMKYDPKTGTNWCHLPLEMRMRCIGEMDYKTRIRLGSSSKLEKSLVESKKLHFKRVKMIFQTNKLSVLVNETDCKLDQKLILRRSSFRVNNINCARYLFDSCDIDSFHFSTSHKNQQVMKNLYGFARCGPLRFKRMAIHSDFWPAIRFFLDKCERLERIVFCGISKKFPFSSMVAHPTVINVKELRFATWEVFKCVWQLVRKWFHIDAEIGKSLQIASFSRHDTARFFASIFAHRVIENANGIVRIRTNNKSKHILFRNIGPGDYIDEYISCKVIPADLPESEYEKGDEWITGLLEADEAENPFSGFDSDDEHDHHFDSDSESDYDNYYSDSDNEHRIVWIPLII